MTGRCSWMFGAVLAGFATAGTGFGEDEALGALFRKAGADGTIILSTLDGETVHRWNGKRSKQRFAPASTFKIPNTLIALDDGVAKGAEQSYEWDGEKHWMKAWNQDQTLQTAFRRSVVWVYQDIARQVGVDGYRAHLKELDYGNQAIGKDVATFWLDGSLTITAEEQVAFMKGLCRESFDFDAESYRVLKEIMVAKRTPEYVLRAKTGWSFRVDEKVRWYVGYVETGGEVWVFAANIDMPKFRSRLVEDGIVMAALVEKGIIEGDSE